MESLFIERNVGLFSESVFELAILGRIDPCDLFERIGSGFKPVKSGEGARGGGDSGRAKMDIEGTGQNSSWKEIVSKNNSLRALYCHLDSLVFLAAQNKTKEKMRCEIGHVIFF